jgi:tellurite resistance protein
MSLELSGDRPPNRETKTDAVSSRIPLNTLAIPFGLIGYAGTWNATRTAFGWEKWVSEPFWTLALAALIWLIVAHTIRGRHTSSTLADQLRHPAQGPLAAILPIIVVLLGSHLFARVPVAGEILVYAGSATGFIFAAWLTALWIRKQVPVEALHGGYFLPTVAAGYISAGAAATIGNMPLAIAAFSMGTFFWIVIFTILIARLALVTPLPGPLTPTLAILAAPPAVGGMAWLAINGRTLDWVTVALLGSTIFMPRLPQAAIHARVLGLHLLHDRGGQPDHRPLRSRPIPRLASRRDRRPRRHLRPDHCDRGQIRRSTRLIAARSTRRRTSTFQS